MVRKCAVCSFTFLLCIILFIRNTSYLLKYVRKLLSLYLRRRRFQEVLKVQVDEEDIQKSPYKEVDTSHIAKETDQLIEAESPIGE